MGQGGSKGSEEDGQDHLLSAVMGWCDVTTSKIKISTRPSAVDTMRGVPNDGDSQKDIARIHAMANTCLKGAAVAKHRFVLELCQMKDPPLVLKKLTPEQREQTLRTMWEVRHMISTLKTGEKADKFWEGLSAEGKANIEQTLTEEGIQDLEKKVRWMTPKRVGQETRPSVPNNEQHSSVGGGQPLTEENIQKRRASLTRNGSLRDSKSSNHANQGSFKGLGVEAPSTPTAGGTHSRRGSTASQGSLSLKDVMAGQVVMEAPVPPEASGSPKGRRSSISGPPLGRRDSISKGSARRGSLTKSTTIR